MNYRRVMNDQEILVHPIALTPLKNCKKSRAVNQKIPYFKKRF